MKISAVLWVSLYIHPYVRNWQFFILCLRKIRFWYQKKNTFSIHLSFCNKLTINLGPFYLYLVTTYMMFIWTKSALICQNLSTQLGLSKSVSNFSLQKVYNACKRMDFLHILCAVANLISKFWFVVPIILIFA